MRARRPQHFLGTRLVGVPGGHDRDDREQDPEPRERMMTRRHGPDVVATEPQPGEKQDEANHQPGRAPAIGFLLLKEITVGRGQPAVPRVRLDLRSPRGPSAPSVPGPRRASWGTAAAWCYTAWPCRYRAAARPRVGCG